jgi:DNA-binding NtrC family response regulator
MEGRMTVLIVDDDEFVGRTIRRMIERNTKLKVVVCESAKSALDAINEYSIDKVFCDLMMPQMNGMEFYKELLQTHPHLCDSFVFCSGSTSTEPFASFIAANKIPAIKKPFGATELLAHLG